MKLSERVRYVNHSQDDCRGRCHLERDEIADEVVQLEKVLSDLMKDYAKRVRNGVMLRPWLQARRLLKDERR